MLPACKSAPNKRERERERERKESEEENTGGRKTKWKERKARNTEIDARVRPDAYICWLLFMKGE